MNIPVMNVNGASDPVQHQCCMSAEPESAGLLVVSSSMRDRVILSDMFQTISCPRHWTASAAEAMKQLEAEPIGVVVCDEQLPDGDWRSILAATRSKTDPPPVIVISGAADGDLYTEVIHAGGSDVIAKPFYEKEVLESVARACRFRRGLGKRLVHREARS